MEKNMYFIKTKKEDTKDLLLKEGFTLLSHEGGVYTFLNDSHLRFSGDEENVIHTNILTV